MNWGDKMVNYACFCCWPNKWGRNTKHLDLSYLEDGEN